MRLINVSNRLPVNIIHKNGKLHFQQSIGGLATGLNAFLQRNCSADENQLIWLGSPGMDIPLDQQQDVTDKLHILNCEPVFIEKKMQQQFQQGFCNGMLWPIFHYLNFFNAYHEAEWQNYLSVNKLFCKKIMQLWRPGDIIWLHDYHLLPLAKFLRESHPDLKIGFFLHIPFPNFQMLQVLPKKCRQEILQGLLSTDLIGFHTHEYYQNFSTSVEKVLHLKNHFNTIEFEGRTVTFDVYPMGIDYEYISQLALEQANSEYIQSISKNKDIKLIFSIDRLDYTKGIANRLLAFEEFLSQNHAWRHKVVLMLIVAPSRENLRHYQTLKTDIELLVGRINGKFSDMLWSPIIYQYKSLNQDQLIQHYAISDVCLVTPLRDGMNLIAKEYIAAKTDGDGVLILSETAGAVHELPDALIVNANCLYEMSDAIKTALLMSTQEKKSRMYVMRKRLEYFNVTQWGQRFLSDLINTHSVNTARTIKSEEFNSADEYSPINN